MLCGPGDVQTAGKARDALHQFDDYGTSLAVRSTLAQQARAGSAVTQAGVVPRANSR